MKSEFVPYELALRLKELGFDEPCFAMWTQGWSEFEWGSSMLPRIFSSKFRLNDTQSCEAYINNPDAAFGIAAPTYGQAFKFFRDNCKLYPSINIYNDKWSCIIKSTVSNETEVSGYIVDTINNGHPTFKTYEEVEIACLEKLIVIVESKSE
jgi:hypothetical protein